MISITDLLVAVPRIADVRFRNSVILLVSNDLSDGSLGICLNRPMDVVVSDLGIPGSEKIHQLPVYWGGPCEPTTLWMLHSPDWSIDDTYELTPEWSMTSSWSMFENLDAYSRPAAMRLFAGYCHWAPGQLSWEVSGEPSFWLTAESVPPVEMFDFEEGNMWTNATKLSASQAIQSWL